MVEAAPQPLPDPPTALIGTGTFEWPFRPNPVRATARRRPPIPLPIGDICCGHNRQRRRCFGRPGAQPKRPTTPSAQDQSHDFEYPRTRASSREATMAIVNFGKRFTTGFDEDGLATFT